MCTFIYKKKTNKMNLIAWKQETTEKEENEIEITEKEITEKILNKL